MPSSAAVISSAYRWIGAWAFAVVVASFVLMGGFMLAADVVPETVGAFAGFAFAAFFLVGKTSFFPALVITSLLRLSGRPRGWTDALAFALAAPILYHAVILGFDFSFGSFALGDPIFVVAGAVGGLVYWWLAGRPSPPYSGWFDPN
tara:strand:- start:100 stop:540 length:441 start_codon:yes stop_codon:yes gene_type:complete